MSVGDGSTLGQPQRFTATATGVQTFVTSRRQPVRNEITCNFFFLTSSTESAALAMNKSNGRALSRLYALHGLILANTLP